MSEMGGSFQIKWDGARYTVSIPNYPGGGVIAIEHYRALQAERDTLLEWKKIILGTGTDQEAVIRMAATEYTQTAIESWKLANEKLTKERDALRAELAKLRKEQK